MRERLPPILMRRAVFLDRDGVLNRAVVRDGRPYPPATAAAVEIAPDAPVALARLKAAGFVLIVVSNQPDVARGTSTPTAVEEINAVLGAVLPVDRFIMCYHDDAAGCRCRKPRPGMLLDGAAQFNVDVSRSYMIGDRWRDMEAGVAAGCATIFLDFGYDERQPTAVTHRVRTLGEAVGIILHGAEPSLPSQDRT